MAASSGAGFQLGGGSSKKESFPRLDGLIRYACESMNVSPFQQYAQENMDAHAAVCDEIASKGIETNAASYAVNLMVQKYINGSVLDNARRALQLLDSCVKNCGDSCHLAVSEKDFLNELVRRFGPTPPPRNVVQQDILKLIETWNRTIAQKSFIKDDLGYIRDMHRLLVNKGFVFPEPDPDDVNALNGLEVKGLQTEDALKDRRNLALKAKLQAYLRRGGIRNLQEANKIIKVLSDYDQSDKAEIRQEAADRVQDVRSRTKLLTERLSSIQPGEQLTSGDAFESLVDDLKSEQHKLHNTLQNDRESEDSMTVLLAVNEEINRVIAWYEALRDGNTAEAQRLSMGGTAKGLLLGNSNAASTAGDLSLIDFDDSQPSQVQADASSNLQDDLLGLSLNANASNQAPALTGQGSVQVPPGFPQLTQNSTQHAASTPEPPKQNTTSAPLPSFKPDYNLMNSSLNMQSNHKPQNTDFRPMATQQVQPSQSPAPQPAVSAVDPFASIASTARASPRPSSTIPPSVSTTPAPPTTTTTGSAGTLLDLGASSSTPAPSQSQTGPAVGGGDDDWDFSGAPPPEEEDFTIYNDDVKIEFQVSRASQSSLNITVVFSNNTAHPVSKMEFLTGMPKLYPRKIDPISSSRLQPHQRHGAYQRFTVEGVAKGTAAQVPNIKWRFSRVVEEKQRQDQGEAQKLSIS